jgi:outer membrane protein assembly factor BamB
MSILLALLLAASPDTSGLLPAPPAIRLYRVAWQKSLVESDFLDWEPEEAGGPAVDAASGTVVVGTRDGALRAFRPDGTELWDVRAGGGFAAAPLIREGVVYAGSLDGVLRALDLGSGRERWRYAAGEEIGSAPLWANGLIVLATFQDSVIAVDARDGAWKWHHRRDQREGFTIRGCARPVLSRGLLLAGYSDGFVAALDPATGVAKWERKVAPAGDYLDVDGLAADGAAVYAAAYSGAVVAIDAETGRTLWEQKAPGASRLLADRGQLYAVTTSSILALSPANGSSRWKRDLGGVPAGPPVRVGQRLAVPNTGGLALVDPGSGRLLRVFDPGTGVSASPAVLGRRAYVLSNGGALTALDVE